MKKQLMLVAVLALGTTSVAHASGFYIGGGLGGSKLKNTYTSTIDLNADPEYGYPAASGSASSSGSNWGVNSTVLAGYAWESPNSYFIGLEVFDNASSAKVSNKVTNTVISKGPEVVATLTENIEVDVQVKNTYGIRALPGMHFTEDTVGYGIVGLARGDMYLTSPNVEGSGSYNLNGYQLGLGAMTNLSQHFALRGDVIYTGYASKTVYTDEGDFTTINKFKPSTMEANLVAVYKFG